MDEKKYYPEVLRWFNGKIGSNYHCDKKIRDLQNFGIILVIPNSE